MIGFYVFVDCCSYQIRNGIWVYDFLIIGAYAGYCAVEKRRPKYNERFLPSMRADLKSVDNKTPLTLLAALLVALMAVHASRSTSEFTNLHRLKQYQVVGDPKANNILLAHRKEISSADILVTWYQPMQFFDFTKRPYRLCHTESRECINKYIKPHTKSAFIFVKTSSASIAFLDSSAEQERLEILADENGYRLYRILDLPAPL